MGRTLGIILVAAGVALLGILALWIFTNEELSNSAQILGLALAIAFVAAPLVGSGALIFVRGTAEAAQMAKMKEQRKLLNIVKTQGEIDFGDLVIEMDSDRDTVQTMLHDLVGKGLYSGYINWEKGLLYSAEASQLKDLDRCKNCGGEIQLAGKGVVSCPYCGTEYFLS